MSNVSIRSIRRLLRDSIAAQAKRDAEREAIAAEREAKSAEREAKAAEREAKAAEREAKWAAERKAIVAEMEARWAAERAAAAAERTAEAAERKAWVKEQERLLAISKKESEEGFKQLRIQLGSHGASHGEFVESLFVNLGDKFNKHGYRFPKEANDYVMFRDENGQIIAEVDRLLENGDTILAVEVKAKLRKDDVDAHLERLGVISEHNKKHNDYRKVLGAVAGGVLRKDLLKYAQRKGLFVLVLNGENVSIADLPESFIPAEW